MTIVNRGESYSSNFSTIFRAARAATMEVEMETKPSGGGGADPLPKYLKRAKVRFGATLMTEDTQSDSSDHPECGVYSNLDNSQRGSVEPQSLELLSNEDRLRSRIAHIASNEEPEH
jgi:hypothetical protein